MTTLGVCLVGHSLGSANLGVGALTLSSLAVLRGVAAAEGVQLEVALLLASEDDRAAVAPLGVAQLVVGAKELIAGVVAPTARLRALAARCDLVVDIGQGDSYTDLYGPWRLAHLVAAKRFFARRGVPVVVAPQTIGPFASGWSRRAAAAGLRAATSVFVRDEDSQRLATALVPGRAVELSTDVAFALPATPTPRPPGPLRVGVNVSSLLMAPGAAARFGLALDFPVFVRRLARAAVDELGAQLVLVPHVLPGNPVEAGDHVVLDGVPEAVAAGPFADAAAAKGLVATLDVLVSARMHATIAAVSSGVATIPIAYSKKVPDLYGSLGYRYWIDARTTAVDEAVATAVRWVHEREQLAAAATAATAQAHLQLSGYEQALAGAVRAAVPA